MFILTSVFLFQAYPGLPKGKIDESSGSPHPATISSTSSSENGDFNDVDSKAAAEDYFATTDEEKDERKRNSGTAAIGTSTLPKGPSAATGGGKGPLVTANPSAMLQRPPQPSSHTDGINRDSYGHSTGSPATSNPNSNPNSNRNSLSITINTTNNVNANSVMNRFAVGGDAKTSPLANGAPSTSLAGTAIAQAAVTGNRNGNAAGSHLSAMEKSIIQQVLQEQAIPRTLQSQMSFTANINVDALPVSQQ